MPLNEPAVTAPSREPLIAARDIRFGPRRQPVLDGVGLEVGRGEIVTLVGPNGAGKTTLVRILLGLLRPDGGAVTRRPGIVLGYVPQRITVDATLPLTVRRFLRLAGPISEAAVEQVLGEVGAPTIARRAVQEISGGELQRVLLARALARDPHLLVLDEPVQGVDFAGQFELYALIGRIRDERGCGILLVSHDLHLVMASTDRVVCLNQHVCCEGHPETVTRDPAYTALFGPRAARELAVYHHHHDHRHDLHGHVVPLPQTSEH